MTKPGLSARAWEILLVIDESSELPNGRFWMPSIDYKTDGDYCERLGANMYISGGGDAKIIQSLRNKFLIEKVTSKTCSLNEYSSRITENGRRFIEDGLENGTIPLLVYGQQLMYVDGHLPRPPVSAGEELDD